MNRTRRAYLLTIKPGYEQEYDRRHRAVWEELLQALKQFGFRNYSIFRMESVLFLYLENDTDVDEQLRKLQDHPVQMRWRAYMSDILIRDPDTPIRFLEEVFHLE